MEASGDAIPAHDWLAPILALEDELGVLSVYVDADPALAAGNPPAWQAPVRAGLGDVAKQARRDWPRNERMAYEARIAAFGPELEAFLGRRDTSRGRALFVGIEGGEVERIELHALLPSLVAFGRQAVVLPLVAVAQNGRRAGVAELSWSRIVVSEWELATLRHLETIELAPEAGENGGRPATNPAVPQPFPERDRYETGVGVRVLARTREAAAGLRRLAEDRDWDAVVVDGDARLIEAFAASLGPAGPQLLPSPQPVSGTSSLEAAARVGAALHERRQADVRRLLDELDASAAATRDEAVVERALAEGRVAHLLLRPAAAAPYSASREALFRRALETKAEVTVIDATATAFEPDGVAALLRW